MKKIRREKDLMPREKEALEKNKQIIKVKSLEEEVRDIFRISDREMMMEVESFFKKLDKKKF
jgi:hypothetical protein